MQNNNKRYNTGISCTAEEAAAIRKYCDENGIILGQLTKRLLLKEIQEKSTLLSADYIPPTVAECLIEKRRK